MNVDLMQDETSYRLQVGTLGRDLGDKMKDIVKQLNQMTELYENESLIM